MAAQRDRVLLSWVEHFLKGKHSSAGLSHGSRAIRQTGWWPTSSLMLDQMVACSGSWDATGAVEMAKRRSKLTSRAHAVRWCGTHRLREWSQKTRNQAVREMTAPSLGGTTRRNKIACHRSPTPAGRKSGHLGVGLSRTGAHPLPRRPVKSGPVCK